MHIPVMVWELKDRNISRRFTLKLQLGKDTRDFGRTETFPLYLINRGIK
jgi:hypothetical protein